VLTPEQHYIDITLVSNHLISFANYDNITYTQMMQAIVPQDFQPHKNPSYNKSTFVFMLKL